MCKKLFCILFILPILLCSCTSQEVAPPVLNFCAQIDITLKGTDNNSQEYTCTYSHNGKGCASVAVQAPNEISGITYKWSGGEYSIELNGKSCKTDSLYIPQKSFAAFIVNVFDNIQNDERLSPTSCSNGTATYCGSINTEKYTLETDSSDGKPKLLYNGDKSLVIVFENVKAI